MNYVSVVLDVCPVCRKRPAVLGVAVEASGALVQTRVVATIYVAVLADGRRLTPVAMIYRESKLERLARRLRVRLPRRLRRGKMFVEVLDRDRVRREIPAGPGGVVRTESFSACAECAEETGLPAALAVDVLLGRRP